MREGARRSTAALARGALLAAAACGGAGEEAVPEGTGTGAAWLAEEARARGLVFEHRSGHDGERYLFPEIMCGGAALLDVEDDGDLDAYLVQAGGLEVSPAERPGNRLFENRGDGRFVDVSAGSGADERGYGNGAAAGDADGDGDVDLYVTNVGANALLRNESAPGALRFRRAGPEAGADDGAWGTSAAFLDHDADGDLDLFVVNYVRWSPADDVACSSVPHGADYCSPLSYEPAPDVLLENLGDGRFRDVAEEAGLRTAFGNGLGVVVGDFDADGRLDVFVANDAMVNQLWRNEGGGRFVDRAVAMGCAVDMDGRTKAGMGVDAADYDFDGDEDLLVVNLHGEADSFYRNDGGRFSDRTPLVGLAQPSKPYTRFGCGLVDLDQDGLLDLYVANGRVTKASVPGPAGFFAEPNLLFRGERGPRFAPVRPRGGTPEELVATSRAAAFGDVDGDGALDVLVVNRDGPAHLLRNAVAERGHWLLLRVLERSGAHALGARVSLTAGERRIVRRVRSAYGYQTANDPRVHVGLGAATRVRDVVVRWVDGTVERFGDLAADRVATLHRGAGAAR